MYEKYKELCKNRLDFLEDEILSRRSINDHVKKADMQGIIQARTISKGRYGRTREVSINFSESTRQDLIEHLHRPNPYLAPEDMDGI